MPKYHLSARIIHWVMSLLILTLLALGYYMANILSHDATNRYQIYDLHKSLGVMVIILLVVRVAIRLTHQVPPLPDTMSVLIRKSAHFGHLALYAFMLLVPLSGYAMSNSFGYSVAFFGIELPAIAQKNIEVGKLFSSLHEIFAYCLLAIVLIHVLGVVKHRFFDKKEHNVLPRML